MEICIAGVHLSPWSRSGYRTDFSAEPDRAGKTLSRTVSRRDPERTRSGRGQREGDVRITDRSNACPLDCSTRGSDGTERALRG